MDNAPTTSDFSADAHAQKSAEIWAEPLARMLAAGQRPPRPSALKTSAAFGWRAMLKIKHMPEQLFDVTALPVMLVLLYTFLFGGALVGSTREYVQFLLPGMMVMSVIMITMYTGVAINIDVRRGVFDRFRTLPIWRPSPMVGYLLGDTIRYTVASTVIFLVGLTMGFRPVGGAHGVLAGMLLLLVFSFALSWVWTMFGLMLRSEKSVMVVSTTVMFPLTFLSSILVNPDTMPGWLQVFVDNSPVTHLCEAVRGLMTGSWPEVAIAWVLAWTGVLMLVFAPVTMWLYARK
ncbi:ABC transporter permease [Streptomyces olivaceus]|uniref:ABC transporter permease n=1 Tax=Streptomyces olivaceus TaxID=47716 RepID=UPI001CCC2814|nr:ABC transporter permease [Streptomyces olivaceus]MBZ6230281.1 ABC transporter permease [Streptomyces olivaceus]